MKKANTSLVGRNAHMIGKIRALLSPRGVPSSLGLIFIFSMVQELSHADELDEAHALLDLATLDQIVETLQESHPEIAQQLFSDLPMDAEFDVQSVAAQLADLEASGYLSEAEAQLLANTLKEMESYADSSWAEDASQDIQLAQAETGAAAAVGSEVAVAAQPSAGLFAAGMASNVAIGAISVVGLGIVTSGTASGSSSGTAPVNSAAGESPVVVSPVVVPPVTGVSLSGKLADGYIQGAQIYIDANGDGIPQESEKLVGVFTDKFGNFVLPAGISGSVIAVGGFNTDTGVANTMIMRAPAGATMVSPLTTLVAGYMQAHPGASASDANGAILTALGLPPGTDLSNYDPIAALAANPNDLMALATQKLAAMVATMVQLGGADVMGKLLDAIAKGPIDLTSPAMIAAALGVTSGPLYDSVLASMNAIHSATSFGNISSAQSGALDHTPPAAPTLTLQADSDSGHSAIDGITNATTPTVRIGFNVTAVDGTAAVVGNTIQIFAGKTLLVSVVLTAADIAKGYVDVTLTGLTANATTALTANMVDAGNNTSSPSLELSLTIDTNAPDAPVIATLAADNSSNALGVTVSGTAEAGATVAVTWGGAVHVATAGADGAWTTGFAGTEIPAAGSISATATDAAGNTSSAGTFALGADAHPTGVLAADVLTVGGAAGVTGMTLAAGQSLQFTADQYLANAVIFGKIDNPFADYALHVSGATSADAISIAHNANVDTVTLAEGQTFHLSTVDFNAAQSDFAKFTNDTADYSVTLDVDAANQRTEIDSVLAGGNAHGYIDTLDLASNAVTLQALEASVLIAEGIHFAADDIVTVDQAQGTHLQTSLHDLQALGVDTVNVGVTSGAFAIAAGAGAIDFAHLPTVHAAAGVVVGLEVSNATLSGISSAQMATDAQALHTAGFSSIMAADHSLALDSTTVDAIHDGGLVFATEDEITVQVAADVQDQMVSNLVGAIDGQTYAHDLDVIDLASNAATLSDAQAASLVSEGLHFAADDTGVAVQAQGTHLQTSLHDLQALGVDTVNVGVTSGAFAIAAGAGAIDFAHLPTVHAAAGVVVGLEVSNATLSGISSAQMATDAQALHTAGFSSIMAADHSLALDSTTVDAIHDGGLVFATEDEITVQVAADVQDQMITNLVGTIDAQTYAHDLDVLDLGSNAVTLTDAQASSLVSEGLHFATDDTGVAVQAQGTHLQTSLHDLQNLGVDFVHADPADASNTVVLDMGAGAFANGALPVFDAQDHVQLNVIDGELGNLIAAINNPDGNFAAAHIDALSVVLNDSIGANLGGEGVLAPAFDGMTIELDAAYATSVVTLGMILDAADGDADPLALLHGQTLADALAAAGISDIKIDQITHFTADDTDLKALMDAGLIKADAGADVTVNHAGSGTLDVTLAQLAGIGADHVVHTGALVVNAGVAFAGTSELEAKLNDLLTKFEDSNGLVDKQLFDNANVVDLHVSGTLSAGDALSTELVAKLTLLGIDDVLDDHGHSLK